MNVSIEELYGVIHDEYPSLKMVEMDPKSLIFEQRVRMNCFYCGKYGVNWRCPPKIPSDINQCAMMQEYGHGAFVYHEMAMNPNDFEQVRRESSIVLHHGLLKLEKHLYQRNCAIAISFIGGSCKLCKNGCGKEHCNNPYQSRSPLEALGVNVIKSAEQYGIRISFPVENCVTRIGLILWD